MLNKHITNSVNVLNILSFRSGHMTVSADGMASQVLVHILPVIYGDSLHHCLLSYIIINCNYTVGNGGV